ncbi:MAG: MBL fold metallo-hydrolase [Deltaproteobacteria bacterium]|nr:MBL fold metallo-hydrolase [Deltaproteobacteria bacterium]
MKLTFLGAAGTVTGSKFLVEAGSRKILFDCGLFQGTKELRLRNWAEPPFDPLSLSAIVLTHAHIDHSGYLPLVVRRGYSGPIYCTAATFELLKLLLPDSAHLQEEEAFYANKSGTSKHHPAKPLYTEKDVEETLKLFKIIERDKQTEILPNVSVEPRCAGHILGSVSLTVDIFKKRITFSGDIGRYDTPLLPPPSPVDFGDLLLCESTYGNRIHGEGNVADELAQIVKAAVVRRGPLIIPAFAVGRTQTLLYYLAELERDGKIPIIPVYVDSPMAVDATKIYYNFRNDFDEESAKLMELGKIPLLTAKTSFCRAVQDSMALNHLKGPRIIISASGMATGGRILHHLKNWIHSEDTTVLFVGYQARGSRGSIIQSGAKYIRIFGEDIPIRAQVDTISGLSAHADRDELLKWLAESKGTPKQVRIIHGEPEASRAFANALKKKFNWDAAPATHMQTVEV